MVTGPLTLLPSVLLVKLRQKIGGPQARQPQFVNRYSEIAGAREELSPAQLSDERPHSPHSWHQGNLPDYTCAVRFLDNQKGRERHLVVNDVNLLLGLSAGIRLGWDVCAHTEGPWNIPNMDSESGKARWLTRRNLEETRHKSGSNNHEGMSLSLLADLSTRTFHLYENSLLHGWWSWSCHWPLVPCGLVIRICRSHCRSLTSISEQ